MKIIPKYRILFYGFTMWSEFPPISHELTGRYMLKNNKVYVETIKITERLFRKPLIEKEWFSEENIEFDEIEIFTCNKK